jgi:putative restriction endonuclease
VDFDARLRLAAFDWLRLRTNDGTTAITSSELADFTFEGEPFRLIAPMQGIWKPSRFDAALSIRTAYRPEGADRPYEDMFSDDGVIHYKWRGVGPNHYENRALRAARELQSPLIWFVGVADATYLPLFPVYLAREDRDARAFVGTFEELRDLVFAESILEERLRRYIKVETKKRLHQPVFRATVMRGVPNKLCGLLDSTRTTAGCRAHHRRLRGSRHASVRNGMALCKIHHAAVDSHILGVRPDLVVEIREDLLREHDGPMLEHGLKQRHNQKLLVLPRRRADLPDPDLLELRFHAFRAAGQPFEEPAGVPTALPQGHRLERKSDANMTPAIHLHP